MNVSIPGLSTAKLDYVKLALLLGDEYVLQQFERLSNSYTKSAMQIIKRRVEERPEDVEAMLKQMKNHLDDIATKVIHSGETNKFTSINTKDSYVEFRSPGGDWLSGDIEKVKNTMLRFVVALDAAADPQKYRQEYLKKLYLVLKPKSQGDAIEAFAKYAAGEFNRSDLKLMIQQIRNDREAKKNPTAQPNKSVYTPPATGGEWSGQWLILDKNNSIIHRFSGIGNQQADANRIAMAWLRANPENMQDGVTVVPEMK
jgi:ribosomal protein S20